jgi:hypothetical protein
VIRCNHCGKLAPSGATNCQSCGKPLGNAWVDGQSDQQELPAWLESLRAQEARPVGKPGSAEDRQPFSMADLVDENALPSWMRLDPSRVTESSDSYPALSSGKQPVPSAGFEASSLIDENALPSWMREQGGNQPGTQNLIAGSLIQPEALPTWMKDQAPAQPVQPPVRPVVAPQPEQGLPASSLLQTDALPAWMKHLEPTGSSSAPGWLNDQQSNLPGSGSFAAGLPATPPLVAPSAYNEISQAPTQGFVARDLVDPQVLPGWMKDGQQPGQSQGQRAPTRPVPRETGFSAGDLVDDRSVPEWLKTQGQGKTGPVSAMGVPVDGSGQIAGQGQGVPGGAGSMGIPASNLLDMNAMPTWMREGAPPAGAQNLPPNSGQGMVAGSLVDLNAMPAWMRNGDTLNPQSQQQQQQPAQGQQRFDGPLVPSRPRTEAVPQTGQSEAAASMFASMLGVSASSPNFPAQEVPYNQGQSAQSVLPGWQSPQSPPPVQGNQGPKPIRMPDVPVSGNVSAPYQAVRGQNPSGTLSSSGYMGAPGGSGYAGAPGQNDPRRSGTGSIGTGQTQGEEAKKKGFFDSIRDFFFK